MNLRDGHIGGTELVAVVVLMLLGKVFLAFPTRAAELGGTAGWALPLLGGATALIGLWAIARVLAGNPGRNLIQAAEDAAGPVGGMLAGAVVAGYTVALFAVSARLFTEAIRVEVLSETPSSVILAVIVGVAAYGAYRGLQVVARTAWLGLPVIGAGIVLVVVLTLPHARWRTLAPVLGNGGDAVLRDGVLGAAFFAELIAVGLIAPYLRRQGHLFRRGAAATLLAAGVMAATIAHLLTVIPPPAVTREAFPLLRLARLIFYGRFLQRLEAPFVVIWVTIALVELAFWLYAASLAVASTLRMPVWRPLVLPLATLGFALAFVPEGMAAALRFEDRVLRGVPGFAVMTVFPLGLWLLTRWRRADVGE